MIFIIQPRNKRNQNFEIIALCIHGVVAVVAGVAVEVTLVVEMVVAAAGIVLVFMDVS